MTTGDEQRAEGRWKYGTLKHPDTYVSHQAVDAVQRFAGGQLWTILDSPFSTPVAIKIDAALAGWEISVFHNGEPLVPATTKDLG